MQSFEIRALCPLSFRYRNREFPVNSVAFFTQRTAFFSVGNVKCPWILAPDSSLHAFAVSHASNRPRFGGWLPASKGPQEDGELPLLARRVGVGPSRRKPYVAEILTTSRSRKKGALRMHSAAQTIARRGSGMSGRLPAVRGPPVPTLLYPQAEGRGNVLASKRSEAQPKTLLVFCRLKDPCWIRIF